MIPEYINTEVEVATKSIKGFTQETRFLSKTTGLEQLVPISMTDSGACANPMYGDGIWTLKSL